MSYKSISSVKKVSNGYILNLISTTKSSLKETKVFASEEHLSEELIDSMKSMWKNIHDSKEVFIEIEISEHDPTTPRQRNPKLNSEELSVLDEAFHSLFSELSRQGGSTRAMYIDQVLAKIKSALQ